MDEDESEIADYNPLPRPTSYSSGSLQMKYSSDHSGPESESGDSDNSNDSDTPIFKKKKPKVEMPKPTFQQKKNKYTIWCAELQESKLTEELGNCDVRQNYERTRDIESYNYKLAQGWDSEHNDQTVNDCTDEEVDHKAASTNKRTIKDRGNVKLRLGRRPSMEVESSCHGPPRLILDLNVTVDDSVEDIASDIANKLCEQKDELIVKVVELAGKQKAIELFLETQKIELSGGMMIMNGSRRRTPGGVFLLLVKRDRDIPQEKQKDIFADDKKKKCTQKRYSHSMSRKEKAEELRRSLSADSMLRERNLPPLATRTELVLKQLAEEDGQDKCGETDGEAQVTNPPPSPATDGRENSSDGVPDMNEPIVDSRQIAAYDDDDFLDIACDNMDVF